MIYFFLFLPLLLFIVTSYMLNIRKIHDGKLYIILLSLFETFLSFTLIFLFFIQGYLPRFLYWFIAFFALLLGSIPFFFFHREGSDQWDLQLETIKNNILIFLKTLLPLYFFLIVFRFWNPILQILTAIILTVVIDLIAKCLRPLFSKPVKQFFRHLGMSSMLKTLWLWVIVAVIAAFGIFFQIPNDSIKSFFNLNDNSAYLTYDEMPVDIQNNYKQDTIYSIKLHNTLEGEISDFYYDEEYLYLYTNRSELLIISNDTSEIIYRTKTEGTLNIDGTYNYLYDEYYNCFVKQEDKLLLFDGYGIYEVSSTGLTKLEEMSKFYSKHYTLNDELWLIERTSITDYILYQYNDGAFIEKQNIDTNLVNYDLLIVISDELFEIDDKILRLHSDTSITFPYRIDSSIVYDSDNQTMYYAEFIDSTDAILISIKSHTEYERITSEGIISKISVEGQHSTNLVAYNNRLFVTGFNTLEIIGEDFEFSTIFNHVKIKTFLKANKYDSTDYLQFKMIDDKNLKYLQSQKNSDTLLLQVNHLEETPNPLRLPFYTHYGFLTIIPILIGCIFELTDYRRDNTYVISFKTQINKKKED